MQLEGFYYDDHSSLKTPCVLDVSASGHFQLPDGSRWHWQDLSISNRIGNSARYLDFPDGSRLESRDNESIDQLCSQFSGQNNLIHRLESRFRYALLAVLITLACGGWFVVYGLPLIADQVAKKLPTSLTRELGTEVMSLMDTNVFSDSRLSLKTRQAIRDDFAALMHQQPDALPYQLHFRDGGPIGANAFALPSGDIVITDQLIKLADHPDAIAGVLAHELGHIAQQHITRRILQNSALPLLITAITGDMAVVTTVLAGLPTLMLEAHYSRTFEEEADQFALKILRAGGRDPAHLAVLLQSLVQHQQNQPATNWLSSHPATEARVEQLQQSGPASR
ncbi:MAG: M48 family metallopeptidase [Pontibacterium sp.]